MEIVGLAGLIAIIWKVVDFAKFVTSGDINKAVTQLSVWGAGIVVALLARAAEPFSSVGILGTTFGDLEWPAIVLLALGIGSTASGVFDFKSALDNTGSSVTPPLLRPGDHLAPTITTVEPPPERR